MPQVCKADVTFDLNPSMYRVTRPLSENDVSVYCIDDDDDDCQLEWKLGE